MLKDQNLLSASKLFEELNDQVSEKITGGSIVELTAKSITFNELAELKLINTDLLTKIEEEIAKRFSEVGAELALGCTSTELGVYNCTVSTAGQTQSFVVNVN